MVFSFSFFLCQWTVNGLTGVALEVVQQLAEEVSGTDVGNVTILHRLMEAKSVQEHLSNQLAAMYKLVQVNFLKVLELKFKKQVVALLVMIMMIIKLLTVLILITVIKN